MRSTFRLESLPELPKHAQLDGTGPSHKHICRRGYNQEVDHLVLSGDSSTAAKLVSSTANLAKKVRRDVLNSPGNLESWAVDCLPDKPEWITIVGIAETSCPTFLSRTGVGQMVLVEGEDRGQVTREYLPGWVLTERGCHVEPPGRLQSANFSGTHGRKGHETSPGIPSP